jgi:predicted phosphodiesterase
MDIAVISDIHGNLPALEAVKEDIETQNPDRIVCLGDIVGYNPWPAECVEAIRDWCDVILQGNHDRNVAKDAERYRTNQMAYQGLLWAEKELTDEQIGWLHNLSPKKDIKTQTKTYTIVHSHPQKTGKYVKPPEFPQLVDFLSKTVSGCWLGHTHLQYKTQIDGYLLLNPGSVGQPRDEDKRAAYAIVDTDANQAELRRVNYDVNEVITKVNEVGLPPKTGSRLL